MLSVHYVSRYNVYLWSFAGVTIEMRECTMPLDSCKGMGQTDIDWVRVHDV